MLGIYFHNFITIILLQFNNSNGGGRYNDCVCVGGGDT